jgi:hypothetical protein
MTFNYLDSKNDLSEKANNAPRRGRPKLNKNINNDTDNSRANDENFKKGSKYANKTESKEDNEYFANGNSENDENDLKVNLELNENDDE